MKKLIISKEELVRINMSQLNFLASQFADKKRDYSTYFCPYCGEENRINSSECKYCSSSLLEYESLIFEYYNLYNEAVELVKNKELLSAYEKIVVFFKLL